MDLIRHRDRTRHFIGPMPEGDLPSRLARGDFHCPPEWVATTATFFVTINCKERGTNQLASDSIAHGLFNALEFYHQSHRWQVDLAMVMPDHFHALMSFRWEPGNGMMALIKNWKRFTARQLGIIWQRDYFDHRIRSETDFQSTWIYIRENPVRAGLVDQFDHWPYSWRPGHGAGW